MNEKQASTSVTNNIAQINIVLGPATFYNGAFIPVFQDPLNAIAKQKNIHGETLRVLMFLLSIVDEKNHINITVNDIAEELCCAKPTVYKAIKTLENMRIICHRKAKKRSPTYELTSKIINPRVAYKGNTRRVDMSDLPLLLSADGRDALIQPSYWNPHFEDDYHE